MHAVHRALLGGHVRRMLIGALQSDVTPMHVFRRGDAGLTVERNRNDRAGRPPLGLPASTAAQVAATVTGQAAVRAYLATSALVTVPEWLPNYTVQAIPPWLTPFQ